MHCINADSNRIFCSSEVQLAKTLRGNLAPGTIQVAYKGVRFIQKWWDKERGKMIYLRVLSTGHTPADGAGLALPPTSIILFFCRPLPATHIRSSAAGHGNE